MAQNYTKHELRPLPTRITQLQYERLQGARDRDGLSIQEHIRRALDLYLAKIEKQIPAQPPADAQPEGGFSAVLGGAAPLSPPDLPPMPPPVKTRAPAPRIRTR
jgi:hypothetical protein